MTIREFAAILDDYSGSLAREVDKLDLERTRGTLNQEEQMDLVTDLREAVQVQRIRPWRKKALLSLIPGVLLLVAISIPRLLSSGAPRVAGGTLGGLLILMGIYGFWMVFKFKRLECRWLGNVEKTIRQGGTVFDIH